MKLQCMAACIQITDLGKMSRCRCFGDWDSLWLTSVAIVHKHELFGIACWVPHMPSTGQAVSLGHSLGWNKPLQSPREVQAQLQQHLSRGLQPASYKELAMYAQHTDRGCVARSFMAKNTRRGFQAAIVAQGAQRQSGLNPARTAW